MREGLPLKAVTASVPAVSAAAVTPDNDTDLATPTRALYIGVSGDVKVDMVGTGEGITFKAVPVGVLPVQVTRVYATGTTATDLLALW